MATASRTWAFASDAEGLTDQGAAAAITFAANGADGNPAGSVAFTCATKAITQTERARKSTTGDTFASLFGLAAGDTISAVRITGLSDKVAAVSKLTSHSVTVRLVDDAGTTIATLLSGRNPGITTTAWVAVGAQTSQSISKVGSDGCRLEIAYTATTSSGGGTASTDYRIDQIAVEVTYTPGPLAVGKVASGATVRGADINFPGAVDDGPKYPNSVVNDATPGQGHPWTNPDLANASDDAYADNLALSLAATDFLWATDFGFAVPTDATITGIYLEFEGHSDTLGHLADGSIRLIKGGLLAGTDPADTTTDYTWDANNTFDRFRTFGGPTDLWGTTWTPADINATNFGAAVSIQDIGGIEASDLRIDSIRLTVSYTTSTGLTITAGKVTTGAAVRGATASATGAATLTPGVIASAAAERGATAQGAGSVPLGAGKVAGTATIRGANTTPGVATLATGHVAPAAATRGSTLAGTGATPLSAGHVASTELVRGAGVSTGGSLLDVGHIASTALVRGASLQPGTATLATGHVASAAAVRGADTTSAAILAAGHIASAAAVRGADALAGPATLSVGHVATGATARGADALAGAVVLSVGHVTTGAATRGATADPTGATVLASGHVLSDAAVRGGTLVAGAVPALGSVTLTDGAIDALTLIETASSVTLAVSLVDGVVLAEVAGTVALAEAPMGSVALTETPT